MANGVMNGALPDSPVTPPLEAISVVIRTFNSATTLTQVLERLDLLPADEVIVVDSGSTDETLAVANRFGARVVPSPLPFHYSRALNAGFQVARNAWVLALSSHSIPVDGKLLGHYRESIAEAAADIAAITGEACLFSDSRRQPAAGSICTPSDYRKGRFFRVTNTNCLYRKGAWEQHPFDENIETAEDAEWSVWAYSNACSLMSCPRALVLYRSRMPLFSSVKKGYRDGRMLRRLSLVSPLSLTWLTWHCFWLAILPIRGRMPLPVAMRRICYAVGDYLGRRSKTQNTTR